MSDRKDWKENREWPPCSKSGSDDIINLVRFEYSDGADARQVLSFVVRKGSRRGWLFAAPKSGRVQVGTVEYTVESRCSLGRDVFLHAHLGRIRRPVEPLTTKATKPSIKQKIVDETKGDKPFVFPNHVLKFLIANEPLAVPICAVRDILC